MGTKIQQICDTVLVYPTRNTQASLKLEWGNCPVGSSFQGLFGNRANDKLKKEYCSIYGNGLAGL